LNAIVAQLSGGSPAAAIFAVASAISGWTARNSSVASGPSPCASIRARKPSGVPDGNTGHDWHTTSVVELSGR
jgi:hypothetical protein